MHAQRHHYGPMCDDMARHTQQAEVHLTRNAPPQSPAQTAAAGHQS